MVHAYYHAVSSAKKFGGEPEEDVNRLYEKQ